MMKHSITIEQIPQGQFNAHSDILTWIYQYFTHDQPTYEILRSDALGFHQTTCGSRHNPKILAERQFGSVSLAAAVVQDFSALLDIAVLYDIQIVHHRAWQHLSDIPMNEKKISDTWNDEYC
jgi:hypothetical protein